MNRFSQDKYLGKAFVNHGRDEDGYDCWGLVLAIYKDLGMPLDDIYQYDECKNWAETSELIKNYYTKFKKVDTPQVNDLVFFKNRLGMAVHIGVVIENDRFIHARKGAGVIISRLYGNDYKNSIEGFYRYDKA